MPYVRSGVQSTLIGVGSTLTAKLRLLPTADVARLGARCYLFDRAAVQENVIYVPTQRVSSRLFDVVRRIKAAWPNHEPQTYDRFAALLTTEAERATLGQLASAGYLETIDVAADASNEARLAGTADGMASGILPSDYFRERVVKHFFKRPAFFHLPEQIDDSDCDVALIGLPISSTLISSGTVNAPSRLRRDSQRAGFWFDFHADGVYSETACDDTLPRLLCVGTKLKDFGDIGGESRTVGDLFTEIATLIETRILPHGIRPVFIGGDHAVTFPIVDCYLRHHPELVLIHLDAHNDLFYTERVEFNHAGPIHALLTHSGLRKVLSMGLRTIGDPRVAPFKRLHETGALTDRVHMYSIGALQRWLQRPGEFRAHLRERIGEGVPCYLTIDLDVLSPECLAGQLSTPAGPGIGWQQLLETVSLMTNEFDVIACDIVEFNPDHKNRPVDDERELTVLLLELIDGLARGARR